MKTKPCSHCKEVKLLKEFSKDTRMKLGYASQCKKCAYLSSKESKSMNRKHYTDYIRVYMRAYRTRNK